MQAEMIYLPSRDLLELALNDIGSEQDKKKIPEHFETLAKRVIEHSNEMKRIMSYG